MADDKRKSPDPADAGRRRQPPTIDLAAQEIKADSDAAKPDTKSGDKKSGDKSAMKSAMKSETKPEIEPGAQPIYSGQDRISDTPTRDFLSDAGDGKAAGGRTSRLWFVAAGTAGGLVVAIVLFVMWLTGMVPIRYAGSTATRARVGVLEMQVQDLTNRKPPAADTRPIDDLGARIAKIEQDIAKIPAGSPAEAGQIAALESTVKALGVAVAGLNRRADDIAATAIGAREQAASAGQSAADARATVEKLPPVASREEVARLAARLSALENSAASTRDSAASNASLGTAVRFALAALALRETVASGAPFASDLAAVKAAGASVGANASAVAPLEPFAATGVPGDGALARELVALVPALTAAAGTRPAASASYLDQLQANAEKLVRIRPAGDRSGGDAQAVVARIEQFAARGEAAAARAELNKLPAAVRAPAEAWMKKFDARSGAIAAASSIAAGAVRALAQP